MIELLERLKNKKYKLILASNTNELHYDWFKKQFEEALALFEDEVISFKIEYRKPEKEFYDYCVERSGYKALQCVFIDDRLDFINVARGMGVKSIWYTSIDSFIY